MIVFITGIACIAVTALCAAILPEKMKLPFAAAGITAGSVLAAVPAVTVLFKAEALSRVLPFGFPFGNVRLEMDPLSALFILVIAVGSSAGAIYGAGYLSKYKGKGMPLGSHLFFLGMLCASMLLLVTVRHALFFLVVWETMSLSSCFCVVFEHDDENTVRAGIFYAVAMHVGVALLIAGFLLLSVKTGSYDFSSFSAVLSQENRFSILAFLLLFTGFGIKAGFVPLHTWLPKAHPAAPSHVSALMSGVMIKTGIYGIFRIIYLSGVPARPLAILVIVIGTLSAVYGILNALSCRDIKKLLAYSSIENIGIIGMGMGFGMLGLSSGNGVAAFLGFAGALFHTVNHSLFKGLMFQSAGVVYQQTHTRDMEKLGGLTKRMPKTAFLCMIGSAAISSLPPLNGFAGELLIFLSMLATMTGAYVAVDIMSIGTIALLGFVGAMAVIAFTKLFSITFLGLPRSEIGAHAKEPSYSMLIPMGFFAALCLLAGIFPQYALRLFFSPVDSLLAAGGLPPSDLFHYDALNALSGVSRAALILCAMTAAVLIFRAVMLHGRRVEKNRTWGCGYRAGSSRIQYTAHSFVHPFVFQTGKVSGSLSETEKPEGIFPSKAAFVSRSKDLVESAIVDPPIKLIGRILARFPELHTGRTQTYILYGFLFLIACLAWTMLRGK